MKNTIELFWSKVNKTGECWIWTGQTGQAGYGAFSLRGKSYRTHRLAYELTHGSIPAGMFVCHTCDVRLCCNPDHLWLGTTQDNNKDMRAKGRDRGVAQPGEANGKARLTTQQVEYIRQHCTPKSRNKQQLARRFGVSRQIISDIVHGKKWRDV